MRKKESTASRWNVIISCPSVLKRNIFGAGLQEVQVAAFVFLRNYSSPGMQATAPRKSKRKTEVYETDNLDQMIKAR